MNGQEVAAIGILAAGMVALALAMTALCLWSLRSKDKVIEPLSKALADMHDRFMAADWLNYIAASQDRAQWIERRVPPSPEELAARAAVAQQVQATDVPTPLDAFAHGGLDEDGEGAIEEEVMHERV